jgi:uncharacterized membrane protein YkvA (DUF1232 family)
VAGQVNGSSRGDKAGLLADLLRNFRLAWRLIRDPRIGTWTKLIIPGIALVYLISPVDILPDVIPVVGQLDDLAILVLAVKLFIELCPQDIVRFHREGLAGVKSQPQAGTGSGKTIDAEYRVIE